MIAKTSSRPRPKKPRHHAPDLLARVPADLLRHLRTHGPQSKTFRAGDIVMPDPACPRPVSRHKLADYVLAADQETVGCPPNSWVELRGHEILAGDRDSGQLASRLTEIDWPVLVVGHRDSDSVEKGLAGRKSTLPPKQHGPIQRSPTQNSWWAGMRMVYLDSEEDRPIEVADVVQSIAPRHLRRLWRVVSIDGSGRLIGRRVSWKTGEVLPGRTQVVSVEVVRLVPRETQANTNQQV